jgi:ABC-type transport system involved in cytochrome bd biosynthesis fused ATPase/permease subunit
VRGLAAAATALLATSTLTVVLLVAVPRVSAGRLDGVYLAMLPLTALAALEAVLPLPAAIEHLEGSRSTVALPVGRRQTLRSGSQLTARRFGFG